MPGIFSAAARARKRGRSDIVPERRGGEKAKRRSADDRRSGGGVEEPCGGEAAERGCRPDAGGDARHPFGRGREWAGRPEVANALVTNPKTPVPLAVKMVPNMSITQARQLAKSANVRVPILKAIRKRIVKR